nr:hypothetical protein [uncultured Carboxylicivirga sp.]
MIKKLKNYLTSLSFFKNSKERKNEGSTDKEPSIPNEIDNTERIVRFIYSPFHLNKKKNKVIAGAYKTPLGMDEVSVNRFNYTNANFCKKHGKKGQDLPSKTFFGLSMLNAHEIKETESEVVYTPILEKERKNPFHSDIKIGFTPIVKGEPFPAEFQQKIHQMAKTSRLYIDENLDSDNWEGETELL